MNIQKVCVIGGGLMGRQIALNTAIYPYEVTIFDANPAVLEDVAKWEDSYLAGRIAKGRMSEEQVAGIRNRFTICATLEEATKDADLVIEAIVERKDIKSAVFKQVDALVRPNTIIATNSSRMVSSLFKDDISHPERLANLHYFNPALVMKLVEVVQGEHCSDETAQALYDFAANTGKSPILIKKEIDGFIANRILQAINMEARWLVEQGYCTPQEVDIACENGLNHPMGPFRLTDLTGIDLQYDILKRKYDESGEKPIGFDIIKEYYDQGRYGKKVGRGFYEYDKK
jgi:3-hydroxybutyryl-CoA dehydrogenase